MRELVHELAQLRGLARQWSTSEADADDLLQETALRALRNLHRFRPCNLPGWLRTVARRLAIDRSRRTRVARRLADQYHYQLTCSPEEEPDQRRSDPAIDPEDVDLAFATTHALREPLRTTYRLAELESLPHDEVARRVGISRGTVASRVWRARGYLRRWIESLTGSALPRW